MTANIIFSRSTLIYAIHAQAPIVIICPSPFFSLSLLCFCFRFADNLETTVLNLDTLFLSTLPQSSFSEVSRALERRCQMKRFLLFTFISCVSMWSGHSELGVPDSPSAHPCPAVLYSLAAGSDLVLLFRSYFLPIQRLSRQFSYFLIVYSFYSEIESKATAHTRSPVWHLTSLKSTLMFPK